MSLSRHAKRKDANQDRIVFALRAAGAVVHILDQPADLLVGYGGHWHLMEVKDSEKPPSARKLTPYQQSFHDLCRSMGLPIHIVTTIYEALIAANIPMLRGEK